MALSQAAVGVALVAAAVVQVVAARGVRGYALRLGEREWEGEGWGDGEEGEEFLVERGEKGEW